MTTSSPGLAQREQRGGDRLGRAGGDEDLAVRVELDAVEAALVRGDRRAQLGDAGPGGYWLRAGAHRLDGGLEDLGRAVRVREALAEVDRAGPRGQRGHLGEDRRAEAGEAGVQRGPVHDTTQYSAIRPSRRRMTSWPRKALSSPSAARPSARPARGDEVAVDERPDLQLEGELVEHRARARRSAPTSCLAAARPRGRASAPRRRRRGRPRPPRRPARAAAASGGRSPWRPCPPDSTARAGGGRRAPRGRSAGRPRTSGRGRARHAVDLARRAWLSSSSPVRISSSVVPPSVSAAVTRPVSRSAGQSRRR